MTGWRVRRPRATFDEAAVFPDLEMKVTQGGVRSDTPTATSKGRGNLRGIEEGA
jgi:hypothetical protein